MTMVHLAPGESTDFTISLPLNEELELIITATCSICGRGMEIPFPVDLKQSHTGRHICECGTKYAFELTAKGVENESRLRKFINWLNERARRFIDHS
jgi:hypothetical protein